jgi:hypothetical protein
MILIISSQEVKAKNKICFLYRAHWLQEKMRQNIRLQPMRKSGYKFAQSVASGEKTSVPAVQ